MGKWTKTAGLLFLAAASVYSDRALGADVQTPAAPASAAGAGNQASAAAPSGATTAPAGADVKLLGDGADPVFAGPATQVEQSLITQHLGVF